MRKRVLLAVVIAVALVVGSAVPAFAATQRTSRITLSANQYKGTTVTVKGTLAFFRNGSWIGLGGRTVTLYRQTSTSTVKIASKVTSKVEGHEGQFSFKVSQAKNREISYVVRFAGYKNSTTKYKSAYKWFDIHS